MGGRSSMEDTHIAFSPLHAVHHPHLHGMAVFDGHGSAETALYLRAHLPSLLAHMNNPMDFGELQALLYKIDQVLSSHVRFGSTLCLVLYDSTTKRLLSCNVGDSRAVVFDPRQVQLYGAHATIGNHGPTPVLFRTEDHHPGKCNEVSRIEKAGAYVLHGRVKGQLAVSRAIGDWCYKRAVLKPECRAVSAQADIVLVSDFNPSIHQVAVMSDGLFLSQFSDSFALCDLVRQGQNTPDTTVLSFEQQLACVIRNVIVQGSRDNLTLLTMTFPQSHNGTLSLHEPPTADAVPDPFKTPEQPILTPLH
jgi:protein phosphatase 2C family protein 2/3